MSEERVKGRKERLELLMKMIEENADDEPLDVVLARFCVETGVTRYTARKYVKLLRDAKLLTV